MNILKFFKLGLALLLATTFFGCEEVALATTPGSDGYLAGDGNRITDYSPDNDTNFYYSPSKGNLQLIRGNVGGTVTSYEVMQMQFGEYADDIEYAQITLNPDTADITYSAEFSPNPNKFTDTTVITDDDTNVITIAYPTGVERDDLLGLLKLSFTTKDGVTEKDYYDVYNSDNVDAIFL